MKNMEKQGIDRSQGTQLESRQMIKLYSVKETCALTGLTRKQLFDYRKMIPQTAFDKSGYKLYDEMSVERLQTVARLRSIDMPLADIRSVLVGKSSEKEAIERQLHVLEERQMEFAGMIEMARKMLNDNCT